MQVICHMAAPVIKPDHSLSGWKHGAVHSANKHYTDKFEALKKQFEELAEDFKWNDIMFNAEFRLKPVIGNEYHLYTKGNTTNKHYISLFAPHEKLVDTTIMLEHFVLITIIVGKK